MRKKTNKKNKKNKQNIISSGPDLLQILIYVTFRLHVTRQHGWGDQEVAGSTPAEVGNILSWRLIMKYFLRSFSPFR